MDDAGVIYHLEKMGIKDETLKLAVLFGYYIGLEDGRGDALQDEKEKKEGEER